MRDQDQQSFARSGPVRVTLLDHSPLVSYGLRAMLEAHSERVTLVDFIPFLEGIVDVDLLLLDPEPAPGQRISPRIFVGLGAAIVLFTWPAADIKDMAAIPGVVGHVPKSASAIELVHVLEALGSVTSLRQASPTQLSDREAQVLALIARGFTNQEVAERLILSVNTVKTYIRSAYAKIGAETRSQATAWTLRNYG